MRPGEQAKEIILGISDHHPDTARCVLIGRMMSQFTGKWTVLVVRVLGRGPCRFNALRREVGEISQKVLTSTLKELEESGLVSRTVTPTKPPQVEYALTDLGRDFLVPVRSFAEWIAGNAERIEAARAAYAGQQDKDRS